MKTHPWRNLANLLVVTLVLISASGATWAQSTYRFAKDSDTVVVRYSRTPGELEAFDSSTRVMVYGDGRVVVHYPEHAPRQGDYETRLSGAELETLIANLVNSNVMEFDPKTLSDTTANSPAVVNANGLSIQNVRHYTADADVSRVTINLTEYKPSGGVMQSGFGKEVVVSDLQSLADRHPDNMALAGLKSAEQRFIEMIDSDKLVPLP